jgi:hypothetical protein
MHFEHPGERRDKTGFSSEATHSWPLSPAWGRQPLRAPQPPPPPYTPSLAPCGALPPTTASQSVPSPTPRTPSAPASPPVRAPHWSVSALALASLRSSCTHGLGCKGGGGLAIACLWISPQTQTPVCRRTTRLWISLQTQTPVCRRTTCLWILLSTRGGARGHVLGSGRPTTRRWLRCAGAQQRLESSRGTAR